MCITGSETFVYSHEVETCLVSAHPTHVSTEIHFSFDPRLAVSEVIISMQTDCLAYITVYESKVMIIVAFHPFLSVETGNGDDTLVSGFDCYHIFQRLLGYDLEVKLK